MSNMLCNIITAALAQAPDIVVAGNVGECEDIASEVRLNTADAVIVQVREPGTAEDFAILLRSFPALKIIAIDYTGVGFVHQLRPYSIRIAELSADVLQSVLRTGSPTSRKKGGCCAQ
jgi:hypothetical protein